MSHSVNHCFSHEKDGILHDGAAQSAAVKNSMGLSCPAESLRIEIETIWPVLEPQDLDHLIGYIKQFANQKRGGSL